MERPKPVPPYLRLVEPSACWKASNIMPWVFFEIPMPESSIENAITESLSFNGFSWPASGLKICSLTLPFSVNLKAFDKRFLRIWFKRCISVSINSGRSSCSSTSNFRFLASDIGLNVDSANAMISLKLTGITSAAITPDSILERSRISLINWIRSSPHEWMVFANIRCFSVRLPSGFSKSCCASINKLLSGVRNSCDILARNSDLYLEVRVSCSAFSSSERPLSCNSSLARLNSSCCEESSPAND